MLLKQNITENYYKYIPGEFLPVYSGGVMLNKNEFHKYRIKQLLKNPSEAVYIATHSQSNSTTYFA